jgi:hypothetical protein
MTYRISISSVTVTFKVEFMRAERIIRLTVLPSRANPGRQIKTRCSLSRLIQRRAYEVRQFQFAIRLAEQGAIHPPKVILGSADRGIA